MIGNLSIKNYLDFCFYLEKKDLINLTTLNHIMNTYSLIGMNEISVKTITQDFINFLIKQANHFKCGRRQILFLDLSSMHVNEADLKLPLWQNLLSLLRENQKIFLYSLNLVDVASTEIFAYLSDTGLQKLTIRFKNDFLPLPRELHISSLRSIKIFCEKNEPIILAFFLEQVFKPWDNFEINNQNYISCFRELEIFGKTDLSINDFFLYKNFAYAIHLQRTISGNIIEQEKLKTIIAILEYLLKVIANFSSDWLSKKKIKYELNSLLSEVTKLIPNISICRISIKSQYYCLEAFVKSTDGLEELKKNDIYHYLEGLESLLAQYIFLNKFTEMTENEQLQCQELINRVEEFISEDIVQKLELKDAALEFFSKLHSNIAKCYLLTPKWAEDTSRVISHYIKSIEYCEKIAGKTYDDIYTAFELNISLAQFYLKMDDKENARIIAETLLVIKVKMKEDFNQNFESDKNGVEEKINEIFHMIEMSLDGKKVSEQQPQVKKQKLEHPFFNYQFGSEASSTPKHGF